MADLAVETQINSSLAALRTIAKASIDRETARSLHAALTDMKVRLERLYGFETVDKNRTKSLNKFPIQTTK